LSKGDKWGKKGFPLLSGPQTASTSKQSDLRSGQTVYFGEKLNSVLKPDYNFYLIGSIGNGYSHHLFNIKPFEIRQDPYGYPLTIWAQIDKEMVIKIGEAKDVEELKLSISEILTRPFVKTIIKTLLTQVELYNRSKSGHYVTYYRLFE